MSGAVRIAVWPELNDEIKALVESVRPDGYELTWFPRETTEDELRTRIADVDHLLGFPLQHPAAETYDALARLKLWQLLGAGYDGLDTGQITRRGLTVCTGGGANAISVAEHTVMLMLAVLRRVTECDALVRAGTFGHRPQGTFVIHELYGATVGLVGLGAIGTEVARRLTGFGCTVRYSDLRAADPAVETELGVQRVGFDELLGASDVVSIHAPLTDATRGLFDRTAFQHMKVGSILVNTARGGLVDEPALVEAIASGRLLGAGLDVTTVEPLAPDDPLLDLGGRVVVTPHVAGPTWESWPRRFANAFANVARVERGEEPLWRLPAAS